MSRSIASRLRKLEQDREAITAANEALVVTQYSTDAEKQQAIRRAAGGPVCLIPSNGRYQKPAYVPKNEQI